MGPRVGKSSASGRDRVLALRLTRAVAEFLARIDRPGAAVAGLAQGVLSPLLDLAIRLWLAQVFWVSGILKLADWQTALYLAANEYPVSWMNPVSAAYLGVSIEIIGALLLAFGLATRVAAVFLLALTIVIQLEYKALNEHLYWAVLFGWYFVMGAGPLSLDAALRRGIARSAVPLVGPIARAVGLLERRARPVFLLVLRGWLGLILAGLSSTGTEGAMRALSGLRFTDPTPAVGALGWSGWILTGLCPILLGLGIATRPAALVAGLLLLAGSSSPLLGELARIDLAYWVLLLGLVALTGPGVLSVDRIVSNVWSRMLGALVAAEAAGATLPHVVIVGAGFAGLSAARGLRHSRCRVTLIDRRNYHLFQPLLYQVATASLSPSDIATPIRELFRDQPNARVLMGRVNDVDVSKRSVVLGEQRVAYDYLVLATGARHSYFGRDEWEAWAPGIKKVEDATEIRRQILIAFERAETTEDALERQRLLTFVVVGGGPTGVEIAGAIAELARHGMEGEFRAIDPASADVVLVQAGPRLLPAFPERLSRVAARSLEQLGVRVVLDRRVDSINETGVAIGAEWIETRTVFWAAGVIASPAAKWVNAQRDAAGRLKVEPDLSVPGLGNVFAIGDTALTLAWNGAPVPGLAPAAKQAGTYVARVIRARLSGRRPPPPFRYRHLGSLATIGRQSAVVDFGPARFSGALAWWLWGAVHVYFLVGMRNRISVAWDWFWAYLTFRRGTRLITGIEE